MKKILLSLFLFLTTAGVIFSEPNDFDIIYDGYQATYNPISETWAAGGIADGEIVLTKKLYDGAGSYSQYLNSDQKVAFTLTSDFELIKDGLFVSINNNELKYNKIIFDGENFEEIPLTFEELQNLFPNAEIIRLSQIDSDNKMWIHKPIGEKKEILFVNDSENCYYKLTPKRIKAQNQEIKGLITISYYGIYRFTHFGKRDGELTIYVR